MQEVLEPLTLDRDVATAAKELDGWRASLATAEGRTLARAHEPFARVRHVTGQSTYRFLETSKAPHDRTLAEGLRRWVYELLQARVGSSLMIDDVEAATFVDPEKKPRRKRKTPEEPASTPETYRDAWLAVLTAEHRGDAESAFELAASLAPRVAAVRKERRARRFEVARRLGLAHPNALATSVPVTTLAAALLDATDSLANDLLKVERKALHGKWHAALGMRFSLARDAGEGWPPRVTDRWLREAFVALPTRRMKTVTATPIGAASFLRAAYTWGATWRRAGAVRSLPFAIARDPYEADAARFGSAFARAVSEPAFQKKVLGLTTRVADIQARALRVALLFGVRRLATRLLLSSAEDVDAGTFEELTERVFGAALPKAFRYAWPDIRIDEPACFLGALRSYAFSASLVDRFDDDWFLNPKAGTHLAHLASAPAFIDDPVAEAEPERIAHTFEELLG